MCCWCGRGFTFTVPYLAPDEPERPDGNGVDDGRERDAHNDEHEVGGGETNDEDVGCVAHVLVGDDDDNDRQVPDEAEHGDEAEDDRNDDADQVLEIDVRAAVVGGRRTVRRRRVVGQRRRARFRVHHGDATRVGDVTRTETARISRRERAYLTDVGGDRDTVNVDEPSSKH